MPFDQFTIEQLAGDMLPNATIEQKIATGFHRNTMVNTEGGVDPEEYRVAAVVDRVNTTGHVWLGMTVGCCQCHDHKYDPFTQKEYYEFMALFNSTADMRRRRRPAGKCSAAGGGGGSGRNRQARGGVESIDAGTHRGPSGLGSSLGEASIWTVLTPTEMEASDGATFTIQPTSRFASRGRKTRRTFTRSQPMPISPA